MFSIDFRRALQQKLDGHDPPWQSVHLAAAMADKGYPVAKVTIDRWLAGETMPTGAALIVVAGIFDLKLAELQPVAAQAETPEGE